MSITVDQLIVHVSDTLKSVLEFVDQHGLGSALVVDDDNVLVGIATDGDIRRGFLNGCQLDHRIDRVMKRNFIALPITASDREIDSALTGPIKFIPLLDDDGHPVDLATIYRRRKIPILQPLLDGNELEYITECIKTNWISSRGKFVSVFEQKFEDLHPGTYAVSVSSGTAAISLGLQALGIGKGDEVILPNITFGACANAIIHAGATPVFVDVLENEWTLNPAEVELTCNPRTKAIMPVHLYGLPARLDDIKHIADKKNLLIIEDCAEALGSQFHGQRVGTFGDVAIFSFFGNKTVSTGEGGMVLFKDKASADHARILRDHGMNPDHRYWHEHVGFNFRMTNMQAAIGVAQLERLQLFIDKKRAIAERYTLALKHYRHLSLQLEPSGSFHSYWLYSVLLSSQQQRDEMINWLALDGIESRKLFYPLHSMPAFQNYHCAHQKFPVSENLAARGLSIPSFVSIESGEIDAITQRIIEKLGSI